MSQLLTPNKYVNFYYDITPELIKSMNGRAIFVDLDGTLVSKHTEKPTDEVLAWIKSFNDAGIEFVLLSNNTDKRVGTFAKVSTMNYVHSAKKPLHIGYKKAVKMINPDIKPSEIVMIGDQIFTDTLASKRYGSSSIYVDPIDKDALYVKFRTRFTEKTFVNRVRRNTNGN